MFDLEYVKQNKQKLLQKAYDLGLVYENKFGGCAPGCLLGCMEAFGLVDENLYRASTGFSGGLGVTSESQCGALSGGVMFLGLLFGRGFLGRGSETFDHMQYKMFDLAQQLKAKFDKEYGSFICSKIHVSKLGRAYKLDDEDDLQEFFKKGCRPKCAEVVALGARWTLEIAFQELEKLEKTENLETRLLYHADEDFKVFLDKHKKSK
jgi:C_GCAxxG_C_C family probable redox protein